MDIWIDRIKSAVFSAEEPYYYDYKGYICLQALLSC